MKGPDPHIIIQNSENTNDMGMRWNLSVGGEDGWAVGVISVAISMILTLSLMGESS